MHNANDGAQTVVARRGSRARARTALATRAAARRAAKNKVPSRFVFVIYHFFITGFSGGGEDEDARPPARPWMS